MLAAIRSGVTDAIAGAFWSKGVAIAVGVAAALAPVPAFACSVTQTAPRDPEVRYAGTSARRVAGTYRIERVAAAGGFASPAFIHGRLTTRRGRIFDVVQEYLQPLVDCSVYDLPVGDAQGIFYLSGRSRDGRYRLLGWTGTHIPGTRIIQPGEAGNQ